jgi:hypothetical protein
MKLKEFLEKRKDKSILNEINEYENLDKYMQSSPKRNLEYLFYIICRRENKERIEDLEPYILENAQYSYEYSLRIIKGRWSEFEESILNLLHSKKFIHSSNMLYIMRYTKNIVKEKWIEFENALLNYEHTEFLFHYTKNLVCGRWLEFEEKYKDNSKIMKRYNIIINNMKKRLLHDYNTYFIIDVLTEEGLLTENY